MNYLALASDYDGTLAHDGHVSESTLGAIERLKASGRKFILVTGRELPELQKTFPRLDVCDIVVVENGAVLYWPSEGREEVLGEPPPEAFIAEMVRREVKPFSCGRCIFATWKPLDAAVLEAIQELGIGYQVILNKGAVMVLPSGINKATGLAEALKRTEISPRNIVAVGDAENDHAFLDFCGVAAAVSNALPALKEKCDIVTAGDHGSGVEQLIDMILADDLRTMRSRRPRHEASERVGSV